MSDRGLLIFDMDGVLVDVNESYREAIRRTVEHFTGNSVSDELIQEFKMQGGWNDDWALSFHLIRDAEVEVGFDTVVRQFQVFFRGENGEPGLIQRERWIAAERLLDRLARDYQLAIFTGRLHEEADVTLDRFAPGIFNPVIGSDDVAATKPAPDGLLKIRSLVAARRVFYLGDTVDDANSALEAKVPFIGVVGPRTPRREESMQVLRDAGALTILGSINELEQVLSDL